MDSAKHERRMKRWVYGRENKILVCAVLPIMVVEMMINVIRFYRPVVLLLVCICAYWYAPNLRMIIDDEAVMSEFKVTDTINAETKEVLKSSYLRYIQVSTYKFLMRFHS